MEGREPEGPSAFALALIPARARWRPGIPSDAFVSNAITPPGTRAVARSRRRVARPRTFAPLRRVSFLAKTDASARKRIVPAVLPRPVPRSYATSSARLSTARTNLDLALTCATRSPPRPRETGLAAGSTCNCRLSRHSGRRTLVTLSSPCRVRGLRRSSRSSRWLVVCTVVVKPLDLLVLALPPVIAVRPCVLGL